MTYFSKKYDRNKTNAHFSYMITLFMVRSVHVINAQCNLLFFSGLTWPFNYHLTFELCALFSVAIVLFTVCFPKSIEKKRTS